MTKRITIALCDDNKSAVEQIKELIQEYLEDVLKTFVGRNKVEFYKCRVSYNIDTLYVGSAEILSGK